MKRILISIGVWMLAVGAGQAGDVVKVQASKKTLHKRESKEQALPAGKSQLEIRDVAYVFNIQRMSGGAAEPLTFEWQVVKENAGGRLTRAASGRTNLVLGLGQKGEFQTTAIRLEGREWTGRRDGEFKDELAGYALRVKEPSGEVVQEIIEPPSLKTDLKWNDQQGEDPTQPDPMDHPGRRRLMRP